MPPRKGTKRGGTKHTAATAFANNNNLAQARGSIYVPPTAQRQPRNSRSSTPTVRDPSRHTRRHIINRGFIQKDESNLAPDAVSRNEGNEEAAVDEVPADRIASMRRRAERKSGEPSRPSSGPVDGEQSTPKKAFPVVIPDSQWNEEEASIEADDSDDDDGSLLSKTPDSKTSAAPTRAGGSGQFPVSSPIHSKGYATDEEPNAQLPESNTTVASSGEHAIYLMDTQEAEPQHEVPPTDNPIPQTRSRANSTTSNASSSSDSSMGDIPARMPGQQPQPDPRRRPVNLNHWAYNIPAIPDDPPQTAEARPASMDRPPTSAELNAQAHYLQSRIGEAWARLAASKKPREEVDADTEMNIAIHEFIAWIREQYAVHGRRVLYIEELRTRYREQVSGYQLLIQQYIHSAIDQANNIIKVLNEEDQRMKATRPSGAPSTSDDNWAAERPLMPANLRDPPTWMQGAAQEVVTSDPVVFTSARLRELWVLREQHLKSRVRLPETTMRELQIAIDHGHLPPATQSAARMSSMPGMSSTSVDHWLEVERDKQSFRRRHKLALDMYERESNSGPENEPEEQVPESLLATSSKGTKGRTTRNRTKSRPENIEVAQEEVDDPKHQDVQDQSSKPITGGRKRKSGIVKPSASRTKKQTPQLPDQEEPAETTLNENHEEEMENNASGLRDGEETPPIDTMEAIAIAAEDVTNTSGVSFHDQDQAAMNEPQSSGVDNVDRDTLVPTPEATMRTPAAVSADASALTQTVEGEKTDTGDAKKLPRLSAKAMGKRKIIVNKDTLSGDAASTTLPSAADAPRHSDGSNDLDNPFAARSTGARLKPSKLKEALDPEDPEDENDPFRSRPTMPKRKVSELQDVQDAVDSDEDYSPGGQGLPKTTKKTVKSKPVQGRKTADTTTLGTNKTEQEDENESEFRIEPKWKTFTVGRPSPKRLVQRKIRRSDGLEVARITYKKKDQVDWNNPAHIQQLNKWGSQNHRRNGGKRAEGYREDDRVAWVHDEKEFVREQFRRRARAGDDIQNKPNWAELAQAFHDERVAKQGLRERKQTAISGFARRDPEICRLRGVRAENGGNAQDSAVQDATTQGGTIQDTQFSGSIQGGSNANAQTKVPQTQRSDADTQNTLLGLIDAACATPPPGAFIGAYSQDTEAQNRVLDSVTEETDGPASQQVDATLPGRTPTSMLRSRQHVEDGAPQARLSEDISMPDVDDTPAQLNASNRPEDGGQLDVSSRRGKRKREEDEEDWDGRRVAVERRKKRVSGKK